MEASLGRQRHARDFHNWLAVDILGRSPRTIVGENKNQIPAGLSATLTLRFLEDRSRFGSFRGPLQQQPSDCNLSSSVARFQSTEHRIDQCVDKCIRYDPILVWH
jgi:hypothetical protein